VTTLVIGDRQEFEGWAVGSVSSTSHQPASAAASAANDRFGISVAISGDTVVVSAFYDNVGASLDQGSAYVFTRAGSTWSQQQKLTASDGGAAGNSVAISGDTVVVGDSQDGIGANANQGSAYVFTVTAPPKPSIAKLTPTAAHRRTAVVITGTGFGTKRGTSYVKFGGAKCGTYLSWSNTRIKCRVPAKARFGLLTVRVTTTVGVSNGKTFRVKR